MKKKFEFVFLSHMHIRLIIVVLLFTLTQAKSQPLPLFNHQQWYKTEDGLPQSFITGIVQDSLGFIWAGTLDGIVRFDGKHFKSYKYNPEDSNSLTSNSTSRLTQSSRGTIIIECIETNVADELNPVSETFHSLTKGSRYQQLFQQANSINFGNEVWSYMNIFHTFFLSWFNPATGVTTTFDSTNYIPRGELFSSPAIALRNEKWAFYTNKAVYIVDKSLKHPVRTPLPSTLTFKPRSRAEKAAMFELPDGRIAMPYTQGLMLWNPSAAAFDSISLPALPDAMQPAFLQTGLDGKCYFAYFDKVYRLEGKNTATLIWHNNLAPERRITSLLIDRTGVMWAGLNAAGIIRLNLQSMPFVVDKSPNLFHYSIYSLLGIPQASQPILYAKQEGSYYFRSAFNKKDGGYYFSFTCENDERLAHYFQNGQITRLAYAKQALPVRITAITSDPQGDLWAYDQGNLLIMHWKDRMHQPELIPIDSSLQALRSTLGYDLLKMGNDLWLSTNGNGLYKVSNRSMEKWDKSNYAGHKLPLNLTDLCPDPSNNDYIWIGSMGSGMFRFNSKTGQFSELTTDDGLPNNTVYCIEPDAEGYLWLSTNKGIARMDPKTGVIHSFDKNDGLPGNEFNRSHAFRFQDGRIAFGGTEGYVVFHPKDFKVPSNMPQDFLHLTALEINGVPQQFGNKSSLLSQSLSQTNTIELPYDQNFITLSFAALVYNDPQKIRYRYRLVGVERNWNEAGNNGQARYTQLRPGKYTLQMNATGFDGHFTNKISTFTIIIRPPFWESWWAYIIYGLLILLLVKTWLSYRAKRRAEKAALEKEHQEAERLREMDRIKEQFFGNITHELRTPITLITAPLDQLATHQGIDDAGKKMVDTARNNSERLLRLINDILDINKLEAGHLQLHETAGEPALFFSQCVEKFKGRAQGKQVELVSDFTAIEGHYLFDKDRWETLLFNLLSNAIKFTQSGGQVSVTGKIIVEKGDSTSLELIVSDTGIGIAPDELENIFNRYYQANHAFQYASTGIGLALVHELVQLMHGTVSVASKPGLGTSFTLVIPAKKTGAPTTLQPANAPSIVGQVINNDLPDELPADTPLVLVVEDNEELRHYISAALASSFRIALATQGAEGWEAVLQDMPDLIVSDRMMPVMDGTELCKKCKADRRTAHIPFVLLTSRASGSSRLEGLGAGADDYLTKPFQVEELLLRLNNLLAQQERLRVHLQEEMQQLLPTVPKVSDELLNSLYALLEERMEDADLGVADLCLHAGLSQSSLNRKLQSIVGLSANDFIRTYRLKKAAALLLAGHDAAQAGYLTGFSSPSYFTKRFREFFGVTPTDYVKQQS